VEVIVEHDQRLNGPHVTMDAVYTVDKGKTDESGTLVVDGGGMSAFKLFLFTLWMKL
jgi:hypothetical protein